MSEDAAIEVRAVTEETLGAWCHAVNVGFLRAGAALGEEVRRQRLFPGRTLGAFEGDRVVATLRSFPLQLTLPGGALLPVSGVSAVTTTQTHRRRGLLSRMMRQDLAAAKERGEAVSILIAAEYAIYGRFGFGPATRAVGLEVDLKRAGGIRADLAGAVGGRLDLVSMAELGTLGPDLHERWRRQQPGAINRDEQYWNAVTGALVPPVSDGWNEPFALVHRDAAGQVTGLAVYQVKAHWDGVLPDCTVQVKDFLALDLPTAVTLWRYLTEVDWTTKVVVGNVGPDDPLPLLLTDPRAATVTETGDFTWLRVLDVPAAFAARGYAGPGRVVLEVADPDGYAAGRWALEVAADGTGRAERTLDEPDLALSASALGTLYLGAESAARLAGAALVRELRPGAAFALDRLLGTALKAWNPDVF
ncbi:GNAT family N-acetyltransferase [Kitasatospora sp. NPDC058965]|uniref:GNAT family N-acetyltransferase n=1 Tax=Kitasatospora sp. NPDC058965 TaxID=3346682 RepID=UPI0036BFCDF6